MKQYIISLIAGLILLTSTSCSESFFDRYPTDATNFDTYCRTVDEVQNVLYAAYGGMRDQFGISLVYIGDLPTDNAYCYRIVNSTDHITLHESSVLSGNGIMGNLWSSSYQIINRCNLVIDNMTEKFPSDSRFNQLVGEAKFLRGLVYYTMVRVYGGVPIVLHDITDLMGPFEYERKTADEVYAQITEDLNDAITKLPDTYTVQAQIGRATKTAAQAILADSYLMRKNYGQAKTLYEAIIAKEGANFGLIDGTNYKSIFSAENVNNKEIIFAIRYAYAQSPSMSNYLMRASLGNVRGAFINPEGYTTSKIYGVNLMMMTTDLATLYEDNDLRRSVVHLGLHDDQYENATYPSVVVPQTLKYFDYRNITDGREGNGPESGCPTIISRYADVILKYAECLNETDPAAAIVQLKRIRDRAGVETTVNPTKADVALAIEKERRLELGLEGHRWFDLKRTGRLQEVMNPYYARGTASLSYLPEYIAYCEFGPLQVPAKVEDYEYLFPIPNAQHLLNPAKLPQNPGY